jgi:LysR family transcriptional activator of nhaA
MASLNYHHLRLFQAVAHDGNLTRAAEALNLSQSALSVQIRKLEERLGHALFERRGRALALTEAGRIALDHADAIFATGDQLLGTLAQTGNQRPKLRVGALATLSRNFVNAFLRPVLGETVDIVLRSGGPAELLPALAALNLDVVLTNRALEADGLIFTRLDEQPVSLVGTPARLGAGAPLATLLASQPLVLPAPDSGVRMAFDGLVQRLGVTVTAAAEIDDMAMMRLLALDDIGLAVLPPIVVTEELAAGRLREAHRLDGISETFFAVTAPRRFPHPLLPRLLGASD